MREIEMATNTRTTRKSTTGTDAGRAAFGGVSTQINVGVTKGVVSLLGKVKEIEGVLTHAPVHGGFHYHGGRVVNCPQVYLAFWGSAWTASAAELLRAQRLMQYHQDLLASTYMNVLSQYGAGTGVSSGAVFRSVFVTNVANNLLNADITNTLQAAINSNALPEPGSPSNTCVIVYLANGMTVDAFGQRMCEPNNDTAFGFHTFFTTTGGHHCYFAIIPPLDDSCLQHSCGSDAGCSLHLAATQEQRETQVASHEFSEMISDPELNAWFEDGTGEENSDIVNGQSATITVSGRTWTVQRQYSLTDDIASNGANFSVVDAPNPLPKLPGGPASTVSARAAQRQIPSYERLLPLPPITFDTQTSQVSLEDAHMRAYAKRIFFPLKPQDVLVDLPGFLNHAAKVSRK
jgi:hypothetical protein